MKIFNPMILIICVLIAPGVWAQSDGNLPTAVTTAVVSAKNSEKLGKMLFIGTINENYFEMTLTRDGENLRGRYFFVRFGKKSALALRGKIKMDGKVVLSEFNGTNKRIGEFRGELLENTDNYDLTFNGVWKRGARRKSADFYAEGQTIGFTGERRIENVYLRERNASRRVELDAGYPQIIGIQTSGARGFNSVSKEMVVRPVAKFNRMVARQTAADRKNMRDYDSNLYSAFSYIKFADDRFVSAAVFYSENSDGMIHTLDGVRSLNYDLEKNRQIKLADLFAPDSKYLETISAYCLKILQSRPPVNGEKLADGDWTNGAAPEVENFECWNLMKKGLLITFNEYSIAPYPAGIQSVLIPYGELKSIARPGGALAKMMR